MSSEIQQLKAAHAHSIFNRGEIERSAECVCFGCLARFPSEEVDRWITEADGKEDTAWCPKCDLDSVIGDASGFPINNSAFVRDMHEYWCNSDDADD